MRSDTEPMVIPLWLHNCIHSCEDYQICRSLIEKFSQSLSEEVLINGNAGIENN